MNAMESEQRKNDLVVFLAHDLKTPLTSIIAYLTMLDEQPELSEEDREKYIHISLEKSIRLGELISEFFEITRFNLQDIVLQKETLDISMMLEQLADESYAVLAEKSLTCSIHTDDNLLVDADPDKLARVFDNLLRNAIAYSYPGTNIDIRAFGEQKDIIITFSNQGDQIPPQKLNFIFEKFYRVDNARQSRTGGAGLGLSIAKEIVELHGGAIAASSSPVCTRFTVKLPRHEEAQPAAAKKWGRIAKNGRERMKKSKKKKTIGDLIWRVVFLAALVVFCYCAFQLITIYLEYKKGTDEYSSLEQKYVSEGMFTENETGGAAGGENRGETDKNGAPVSSQVDASGAENDSEGETAKDKTDLEKEPYTTGETETEIETDEKGQTTVRS